MASPEENVQFIRDYLMDADQKVDKAGGTTTDLSVDQFQAYTDDTVFYFDRKEYRGYAGLQEFIALLAPYKVGYGEIVDLFGSKDRVTLVLNESLERISDGERIDYVRTATYKIKDNAIAECWITDAPPAELAEFLGATG